MAKKSTKKSGKGGLGDMAHQALLRVVRHTAQRGQVEIDTERCKGCELCVFECPAHTLELSATVNRRGYRHSTQVRPEHCIGCASCALICPDGCIEVMREGIIPHRPLQTDAIYDATASDSSTDCASTL